MHDGIRTKEDLLNLLSTNEDTQEEEADVEEQGHGAPQEEQVDVLEEMEQDNEEQGHGAPQAEQVDVLEEMEQEFIQVRQVAAAGQESAARRMKRRATHMLTDFECGDNATLKVPEFDRGPTDPRNLLVVVLSRSKG